MSRFSKIPYIAKLFAWFRIQIRQTAVSEALDFNLKFKKTWIPPQGQATLKTAEDRAQFGDLARLLQLDIHMEQETIADTDKEEEQEEEVVKPTPEKTRGRPKVKKSGGGAQVQKPAAKAESDEEKDGAEAPKADAEPAAALAAKKVAQPPPPDTSSVESISEILKAAPRVR